MLAALIVNPGASRVTPELTAAVEAELSAAGPVETILTERPGHAVELVEEASRRYERIYVYSGDGGFNEAVNGLDGDMPEGYLQTVPFTIFSGTNDIQRNIIAQQLHLG